MQQSKKRIQQLWQSLQAVDRYHFDSFPGPGSMTAWQGSGTGSVSIQVDDKTIRFNESGQFHTADGSPLNSTNVFIWEQLAESISLSHHRHDRPVHLFELIPTTEYCWSSAEDHLCGDDVYSGKLKEMPYGFELTWRVRGPRKDECLFYRYVKSLDDKVIAPSQ
jgi:hypothetical protein